MKIKLKDLKAFKPCTDGFKNYLEVFGERDVDWLDFLDSDKIPTGDKHWLINRGWKNEDFQRIQRDYALICSDRATFDSTPEIKEFWFICALINASEWFDLRHTPAYESADWSAYWSADRSAYWSAYWSADWSAYSSAYSSADRSADRSAYWSADWSAYSSADRSAERKIQIEIFASLVSEYLDKKEGE